MPQKQLAEALFFDPSKIASLVARLEETALVVKHPSTADGRQQDLFLKSEGEALLAAIGEKGYERSRLFGGGLCAPQRASLIKVLVRLRHSIRQPCSIEPSVGSTPNFPRRSGPPRIALFAARMTYPIPVRAVITVPPSRIACTASRLPVTADRGALPMLSLSRADACAARLTRDARIIPISRPLRRTPSCLFAIARNSITGNQRNLRAATEIQAQTERPEVSLSMSEMDQGSSVIFEVPGFTNADSETEQGSVDALRERANLLISGAGIPSGSSSWPRLRSRRSVRWICKPA